MGAPFNSVRSFHFRQLVAEHNPSGRVPLGTMRVFWRAATKLAREFHREAARAFTL
jgi:hypothetical protein